MVVTKELRMFSSTRLVALRQGQSLSRSDLHRALVRRGLTRCRSLIDRWETGKSEPSASEAALLAAVLGASLEQLFAVEIVAPNP